MKEIKKQHEYEYDIFGEKIEHDVILRDKFIEPPFSVLDTKSGNWQRRKRLWKELGIESEVGRKDNLIGDSISTEGMKTGCKNFAPNTSIFDPALCEVLYHWFCPENGKILDPFAGGSVRGIVAHKLEYKYTGIDIRPEQIDSNRDQANDILEVNNLPNWYEGDSNEVLNGFNDKFDLVFSCPPYADLEVYSDMDGDISNMDYKDFMIAYESIIKKSCDLLKVGGYACFIVGEVRDKKGNYIGFVPDTINAFKKCGMNFYNEAILLNMYGTAAMRSEHSMKYQKLVKVHQNVLIFIKPNDNTESS